MRTVLNSAVDPLLGRLLDGRYEISGRLAQGGMAVVYSAFDTRLDRSVAVKVMHPALAADEDFVARFRREAKAAARLSNPHVVAVTDQGRDGDVIFLVMELIEGRTLREVLREAGRLSAPEALEIMLSVLDALAAAHRAGLVHRDVKPENVLVADDGAVKVGDFGLARAVDASPLTATTGLLLGTVAYLAPEQVARGVADARADVYACGVMLFELLTGKPPFEGTSPLQVAYQHLNDNVPAPSSRQPDVPASVDRLVAAATARDPADRPHDATALLFRTRAVLDRLGPAPAVTRRGHNDTAPLELDLAEAAALDLARRGKPASGLRSAPATPGGVGGDLAVDEVADDDVPDTLEHPVAGSHTGNSRIDLPDLAAGLDAGDFDADADADALAAEDFEGADEPPAPSRRARRKQRRADRPKRRLLRPGRLTLLILLILSLVAGLIGWQLAGRKATVPNVIGKSPAAAEAALRSSHLSPSLVAATVYSETVPKGEIGSIDPGAGRKLRRGGVVTLKLSLGPERYTVPTLGKLSVADAINALRVSHLRAGKQTLAYSDTVPANAIISFTPPAGTQAKPDTAIDLAVSQGPQPVKLPKLTGLTGADAQQALQKLGLKVTVKRDFSDTVNIGFAIGATPTTGLHRTQTVTLSVSKGPQVVTIPPGIENDNPGYAKQVLQSLGLNVVTHSYFPGLDSSILTVRPSGGTVVRVGSQVSIYLY